MQPTTPSTDAAPAVPSAAPTPSEYQAPAIEDVITIQDLKREVLYAGTITSAPNTTPLQ